MPNRGLPLGERISSLEAKFDIHQAYTHERWHQLANDLQPMIGLPMQLTRDLAKMEGKLEAKIDGRLSAIEVRLSAIEAQRQQMTGAKQFGVWLVQTALAAIAAAGAAVIAVFAIKGGA